MKPAKPQKPSEDQEVQGESNETFENMFDPRDLPTGRTGRFLVTLNDIGQQGLMTELKSVAGLSVASTADFENGALTEDDIDDADALIFEKLGVAVVDVDPNQLLALETSVMDNERSILSVEPEEFVYALQESPDDFDWQAEQPMSVEYLMGFRDGLDSFIEALGSSEESLVEGEMGALATYSDTATLTWGLQATKASSSHCTGRGIRIAVLDTGFDLSHPDFIGRSPLTASFISGQSVQDGHGHGTHCIGTSCGSRTPADTNKRYGIAHGATILAGKVLSNAGSGSDSGILAGINWALQNNATIISMSLGSGVAPGQPHKAAYEQAAQAALNANCLIIAAAGNSGNSPVGSPANCPSIMAVAAVDANLNRASFSCIGINGNGGEVDIAGPGVGVYSSTKLPAKYASWNGTSMATPHVAGCAALWAQNKGLRGKPLWNKLVDTALALPQPVQHVGAGLVQAPSCRFRFERPPWYRWRYRLRPIPRPILRPIPGPIPRPYDPR
jgi:subtilisin